MNIKRITALVLAMAIAGGSLAACSSEGEKTDRDSFDYSARLDDNGFFKDVKALDYVTLPDYSAYTMPREYTVAAQEDIDRQLEAIKNNFKTTEPDTDTSRVIADGDSVNIDYVGSIDGVEFDGGSTQGQGTDVTIGYTDYIDGFLDQLIGHKAGETFDINVPFPDDYGNEELKGKDAVFKITINHIYKDVYPEITDEFVAENLSDVYSNVEELMAGIEKSIIDYQQKNYLFNKLISEAQVNDYPQQAVDFANDIERENLKQQAAMYGIDSEELPGMLGFDSMEDYLESIQEDVKASLKPYLIIQAIAEKENMSVSDEDIAEYFKTYVGTDDYSAFETNYGMPYIKFVVMNEVVLNKLIGNMQVA